MISCFFRHSDACPLGHKGRSLEGVESHWILAYARMTVMKNKSKASKGNCIDRVTMNVKFLPFYFSSYIFPLKT
jgi:hypothetical protein